VPDDEQAAATARRTPTEPIQVDSARVVAVGVAVWLVALAVTLLVPALHSGGRSWWPWACVSGAVLGLVGLAYLRRGRGNAAGA
jgi:protein-S-isoprenylcysteine O-methyltransferase Ste14